MAVLTHNQLESIWVDAGGLQAHADVAAAIAQAESGGCVTALAGPVDIRPVKVCTWNKTSLENSCGLWQINLDAHPQYSAPSIFDPITNAAAAVAISSRGASFAAWTTYTNGAYRQYLTGSTSGVGTGVVPTVGVRVMDSDHGWSRLMHAMSRTAPRNLTLSGYSRRALRRLSQAGRR